MRPPLLALTTFNRLGSTIESIDSALKNDSDFEMIILDNNSKDKTRDYLRTIKDSRIKEIKLFDTNIGGVQAVNYALTKRYPDQDFINMENDVKILTSDFVKKFRESCDESGASQVHAMIKRLHNQREHFANGIFLKSPVYGAFYFIPAKVMNIIKFYDEKTNRADIDLNRRLGSIGAGTGYTSKVEIIIIQPSANQGDEAAFGCDTCIQKQNICRDGSRKCLDFYARLHINLNQMAHDRKPINEFDDLHPSTCHIDGLGPDESWFRNLFQSEYEKALIERGLM